MLRLSLLCPEITSLIISQKCDERRPFCLRCERAEFDCEGYALPVKVVHAEAIWQLGKGPRRLTAPNASPAWAPLDETEVGYFDLFRHQLIHDLAGYNQQDCKYWVPALLSLHVALLLSQSIIETMTLPTLHILLFSHSRLDKVSD